MPDHLIYGIDSAFQCVQRTNFDGSAILFGPGTRLWAEYVSRNGLPPAIGTPTDINPLEIIGLPSARVLQVPFDLANE